MKDHIDWDGSEMKLIIGIGTTDTAGKDLEGSCDVPDKYIRWN